MRSIIYFIIILVGICMAVSGLRAANIYMWTDEDGRMHITDKPPEKEGKVRDVIEYEPGSAPPSAAPSPQPQAVETESKHKQAQCRNVYEARRTL
jgi:hypothetical protein